MTGSPDNPPSHLVSHFAARSPKAYTEAWSELWESHQSGFWDREMPSPALVDFVESRPAVLHPPAGQRRLRTLVPGCGKGYDLVMLALHGFDVYGLEVSEKGAQVARSYAVLELLQPKQHNYGNRNDWLSTPTGAVKVITGDFFKRDWQAACAEDGVTTFDVIYDYTFLCAILPEMRESWTQRMAELLSPTGVLVCLEFPLYKDLKAQGPPWGLRGVHWNLLAQGGDGITRIDELRDEVRPTGGLFHRVLYFKPPHSYENGKGTDMLSVWALVP